MSSLGDPDPVVAFCFFDTEGGHKKWGKDTDVIYPLRELCVREVTRFRLHGGRAVTHVVVPKGDTLLVEYTTPHKGTFEASLERWRKSPEFKTLTGHLNGDIENAADVYILVGWNAISHDLKILQRVLSDTVWQRCIVADALLSVRVFHTFLPLPIKGCEAVVGDADDYDKLSYHLNADYPERLLEAPVKFPMCRPLKRNLDSLALYTQAGRYNSSVELHTAVGDTAMTAHVWFTLLQMRLTGVDLLSTLSMQSKRDKAAGVKAVQVPTTAVWHSEDAAHVIAGVQACAGAASTTLGDPEAVTKALFQTAVHNNNVPYTATTNGGLRNSPFGCLMAVSLRRHAVGSQQVSWGVAARLLLCTQMVNIETDAKLRQRFIADSAPLMLNAMHFHLACAACKVANRGASCTHMEHKRPPWLPSGMPRPSVAVEGSSKEVKTSPRTTARGPIASPPLVTQTVLRRIVTPPPQTPVRYIGRTTLVLGPMFAGKTLMTANALAKEVRSTNGEASVVFIKHTLETRESVSPEPESEIESESSRDRVFTHSTAVSTSRLLRGCVVISAPTVEQAMTHIPHNTSLVGIDEGQFFDDLAAGCLKLTRKGINVHISALNSTADAKQWSPVSEVIALGATVQTVDSVCDIRGCHTPATMTMRKPTKERAGAGAAPTIVVGAGDVYAPVCRFHHPVLNPGYAAHAADATRPFTPGKPRFIEA